MAQVFPRWANAVSRVSIVLSLASGPFLLWLCLIFTRSSYGTGAGTMREQPVPFSHEHHVGVLGIDCRYSTQASKDLLTPACPPRKPA